MEVYGVFEGGGVRGTALVGAVAALEEHRITFRAVAGTSAGAIVASLVAAGYSASDMHAALMGKDFRDFKDPISGIPVWRWLRVWRSLGLYKGDEFHRWIGEQISRKLTGRLNDSPRFEELPKPLTIIATDVVRQQVKVFSRERTPDVAVADAVRMSMSIPFFFRPVSYGRELLVDGGVLSNFPAWAFDEQLKTEPLPVLGLRLQPDDTPLPNVGNVLELAMSLVNTAVRASTPLQITHVPNLHVIDLPTKGVQTTDFDISNEAKSLLYESGRQTAAAYLETTDLTRPPGEVEPAAEPRVEGAYDWFAGRGGITRGEDFFDREGEQRTLRAYMRGRQNCQIVGPRRIGKSSLLRQVERVAPTWDAAAAVAYIDLQDPRGFTLAGLLDLIGQKLRWTSAVASPLEFMERVEEMLAGGVHPILCLDEFEELTRHRAEFTTDFFLMLRACGQRGMSIVTASRRPLHELTESGDPTSPFYNTFPLLRLGPFAPKDAEDFVDARRPGVPPFTPEEKAAILDFAKGHPLALQVACFNVLESKENHTTLSAALEKSDDDMKAHIPQGW